VAPLCNIVPQPFFITLKKIKMKALLINGSPHNNGNTALALTEIGKELNKNGIDYEIIGIGNKPVMGCIACNKCAETGVCAFQDEAYKKIRAAAIEANAIVIGSPVYYAGPNGALCAILDRLFYSSSDLFMYKPGAAVAVCRRSGDTAALDRLNKYFTINNMPLATSQYWNGVHGLMPGEAAQDKEGMQIMRSLAKNLAWLMKNTHGKETPQPEPTRVSTNFIR